MRRRYNMIGWAFGPAARIWCVGLLIAALGNCAIRSSNRVVRQQQPSEAVDPESQTIALPDVRGPAGLVHQPRLGEPIDGLTPEQAARFVAGKRAFRRIFRPADGLGPVFNFQSCAACHSNPIGGSGTITVTLFGRATDDGYDSLETLGGPLLQAERISEACAEEIPREANVMTERITTSALGAGLIEAIPDSALAALESSPPAGVSGRVHWVQPLEADSDDPLRAGRFGLKCQVATVLTFSAMATLNEMGITNRLLPEEVAPNGRLDLIALCDEVPDPEDRPDAEGIDFVTRVTDFQRYLAPPPQTPRSGMTGERVFVEIGCADCHTPSFTTSAAPGLEESLRSRKIMPYSDFLLHDMGALGDGIRQGQAEPQELRTAALWGFRIRFPVLHDGRVSGATLTQRASRSIRQHGGEGAESVRKFEELSKDDRAALYAFIDSLGRVEFDDDGDNDVDLKDLATVLACQTGPRRGTYTPDDRCAISDVDQDGDVDLIDHAVFQRAYSGPLYGTALVVP